MPSNDLLRSWQRTEALLAEAKSRLSQEALDAFPKQIADYVTYIEHNEFGLACDTLEYVAVELEQCPSSVLELLALAAGNMEQHEQRLRIEEYLARTRA